MQPLLCHPPLLPGESLPSLIARLAKENAYEPQNILLSMIKEANKKDRKAKQLYLSLASQFKWLEALTYIEPYKLYRATDHYFSSILTPPECEIESIELSNGLSVPLLSRNIAHRHVRPEYASQFCPLCLKVAAYHRINWSPMASAACLDHKCLLVSSCPGCGKAVRISDIIEARCSKCRASYTEVEPISVENDSFGLFAQSLIQTWLAQGIGPISPDFPLPQQTPRNLYRIIDGLRLSIMQVDQDWPLLHYLESVRYPLDLRSVAFRSAHLHILTAYQSYCLYATACKGIINWPLGFHQFLTAYRGREKAKQFLDITNSLRAGLGILYDMWLSRRWNQASLEFVQQAFYEYLADNHLSFPKALVNSSYMNKPELVSKLHYMSAYRATKLLGTSTERLKLLIQSGRLMSYKGPDKTGLVLVKREDVLELRKKWDQALDIKEAANWLGVAKKVVPQLVKTGLLTAQQTPADGPSWMFSPADITDCLERIAERVDRYSSLESIRRGELLSFKQTSSLLHPKLGSASFAFILHKVVDGDLHAYISADSRLQLRSLTFARSDIDTYIEFVKAEQDWINCYEVANILGINRDTVMSWLKSGLIPLLTTRGHTYYFDRKLIEKLGTDLLITNRASKLLGMRESSVCSLARQGRLDALKGPAVDGSGFYLFSRESLLGWRQDRLTTYEAQCQLQVSYAELASLVRQGKLIPLEDKALRPWFFSRQHISSFGEQSRPIQP